MIKGLLIKQFIQDFLHVLVPTNCVGCELTLLAHENILCTSCLYGLPLTDFHLDPDNQTARQLWGKLDFKFAASMLYLAKSSSVEKILHNLKYGNHPEIGYYLGKLYANSLVPHYNLNQIDFVMPVPLHRSKLHKRGYNQSSLFAKGIAEGLAITWTDQLLIRSVATVSQTKKGRSERYENVENVFSTRKNTDVQGRHILLVDDVLTTGATLCSLGNSLIKDGAVISVVTVARA